MPVRPNGTVVADLDHDTFGNREIAVESFAQPFGYTGREYDADTGLYHYRAREYDPVAGRFLQEDPIWYASGDMNVYRYVLSNPVRYRDPSGNAATEYACFAEFAAGAGTAVGAGSGIGLASVFFNTSAQLSAALGDGERAEQLVEAIEIGEEVAAWDQGNLKVLASGVPELAWRRVTAKSSRLAGEVVKLTVRNEQNIQETVTVTGNHPYLRPDGTYRNGILDAVRLDPAGEWSAVEKLKPGDELVSALGGRLIVDTIEIDETPHRVYDLEVDDLHTFAVGKFGAWVHNGLGAYVICVAENLYYVGKGDINRAKRSARAKGGYICQLLQAETDCGSFILEHRLMEKLKNGGASLLNKIRSPGANMSGGR